MKLFKELTNLIVSAENDAKGFYEKGNKAAGTRLRVTLQKIKVAAQDLRVEISTIKNKNSQEKL